MPAVDRNTGQPAASPYAQQSFDQTQTTGPSTTNTTGTTTSNTQSRQVTASSSYALNTTPQARDALNNLIETLQDRPIISQDEANAKFPLATATYSRYGAQSWVYTNPMTGLSMSAQEAQLFNQQQQAKQQEYVKSGGMIAGGTIEQKAAQAERQIEIERNRVTQDKYSKEAAIADSKALSNYFSRVLTEQQMPGILRAAEGSGASQSSTRALLTNDAIARTSESAAKTGIEAAVAYGGINTNLAQVLEQLTRSDPNGVTAQLLQALNVAKGIETSGSNVSVGTTNQTTTGTTDQTAVNSGNTVTTSRYNTPVNTTQFSNPSLNVPTASAYTPSSQAGTGYVVANPTTPAYQGAEFVNYGGGDSNVFFDSEE